MSTTTSGSRLASAMTPKQYLLLSTLVLYTSGLSFLMHRSRQATPGGGGLYSVPTSIFLAELLKLAVSLGMSYSAIYKSLPVIKNRYDVLEEGKMEENALKRHESDENKGQSDSTTDDVDDYRSRRSSRSVSLLALHSLWEEVLTKDCWKLGVPAALYVAQNNLQMASISAVSAVTYQAVTQSKLLATALLSTYLLSKRYTRQQWTSIFILLVGVVMVSVSKIKSKGAATGQDQEAFMIAKLFGVMGVFAACTLGSGAAVYMEKVLKMDKRTSLWIRNAQLSLFSLIPATFAMLYEGAGLKNFTSWAWITVVMRSLGGFLIALILQQTDSILKGIATSVAMVLSILIESIALGVPISVGFAFGAALVVFGSVTYVRLGSL
ncbi:hypothetical protein CBS101457_003892 [Exobasidium rhododendri]|nr:hypothetical protein CBS101457_003892 [Exobasidium rhododendri]